MNTVPVTPITLVTSDAYKDAMQLYDRGVELIEALDMTNICACKVLVTCGKWTNQNVPMTEIKVPQEAVPTLILASVNMQLMAETRLLRKQHEETV
jgi:hypothetical protein